MINKYQVYRYFEYLIMKDIKKYSFNELKEEQAIFKEISIRKSFFPKKIELETLLWWEKNNYKISSRLKHIKKNIIKTSFIEKYINIYMKEKINLMKELCEKFD